jgi:hypothetical protein
VGFPVVMKVVSPDIAHKADRGLVRLGVGSATEAKQAYASLMRRVAEEAPRATVDGIVVCESVVGGIETMVGVSRDDVFGPTVTFGLGGSLVEVLDDVAIRVPPFDRAEARRMIESIRGADLLRRGRGRPAVRVAAIVDTIMAVQRMAIDHADRLAELDINPLVVTPERAVAVDALAIPHRAGDKR